MMRANEVGKCIDQNVKSARWSLSCRRAIRNLKLMMAKTSVMSLLHTVTGLNISVMGQNTTRICLQHSFMDLCTGAVGPHLSEMGLLLPNFIYISRANTSKLINYQNLLLSNNKHEIINQRY